MESKPFRHPLDKHGACSEAGASAEAIFQSSLAKYMQSHGTDFGGQISHQDFLSDHGSFDIKAMKKISRECEKPQHEYVWIEFKNVAGNYGWLYGKADYIAFERPEDFVVVRRSGLVKLCEKLVDPDTTVKTPHEALYKMYQRQNRKDLLSLIKMSDLLENLNPIILEKYNQQ